jgi:hypothetical protein
MKKLPLALMLALAVIGGVTVSGIVGSTQVAACTTQNASGCEGKNNPS